MKDMDDQETVNVTIDTINTDSGRGIRVAMPGNRHSYAIPTSLLVALDQAYQAVDTAQAAIMEHIGRTHPDDTDVQTWLQDHRG